MNSNREVIVVQRRCRSAGSFGKGDFIKAVARAGLGFAAHRVRSGATCCANRLPASLTLNSDRRSKASRRTHFLESRSAAGMMQTKSAAWTAMRTLDCRKFCWDLANHYCSSRRQSSSVKPISMREQCRRKVRGYAIKKIHSIPIQFGSVKVTQSGRKYADEAHKSRCFV